MSGSGEEVDCPSCQGSGETPVQDHWSYGDSKGRGEGHYTTGGDECPCCKGTTKVPSGEDAMVHSSSDSCWEPDYPDPPERED